MPEWLIERGIGETRAALVEDGEIIEACIELEGIVPAGTVLTARLTSIGVNGRNAVAATDDGAEYLLPRGAPVVTQGAKLTIQVTRAAIPGAEPWKRPLAQLTDKESGPPAPPNGRDLVFPAAPDELGNLGWDELIDEARTGAVAFVGGELRLSVTPAMTLIDVDGYLPPDELARAGATAAARAIRRLGIGGSIGIDLPTVSSKGARQAAAAAIDAVLPQPFERTAVNGFGFVQIVRPRLRASLLELAQDRAPFEVRALLRRVSFDTPGSKTIVAHPSVLAMLEQRPAWIESLSRQMGGVIGLRTDASVPMSSGYAEQA